MYVYVQKKIVFLTLSRLNIKPGQVRILFLFSSQRNEWNKYSKNRFKYFVIIMISGEKYDVWHTDKLSVS